MRSVRVLLVVLLVASTGSLPASSRAAEDSSTSSLTSDLPPPPPEKPRPPPVHLELGARLLTGRPIGEAAAGLALSEQTSGFYGVGVDAGVRLPIGLFLGVYAQWAYAAAKKSGSECPSSATGCSGTDVRLGLEAIWHLLPDRTIDPFVGIGLGREWLTSRSTRHGEAIDGARSETDSGWEYAHLELGADWNVDRHFALGPFVTATLARFGHATYADPSITRSGSISNPSVHAWILLGLGGHVGIW